MYYMTVHKIINSYNEQIKVTHDTYQRVIKLLRQQP